MTEAAAVTTCQTCRYARYADQPCPGCEGGPFVTLTLPAVYVSSEYASAVAHQRPPDAGGGTGGRND